MDRSIKNLIVVLSAVAACVCVFICLKRYNPELFGEGKRVIAYLHVLKLCCPLRALFLYVLLCFLCTVCAMPLLMPLAVWGGMLFGTLIGGITVVGASVAGAVVSFLIIKKFFLPLFSDRYAAFTYQMQQFVGAQGMWLAFFVLHIVGVVPYVMINTLAAVSGISIIAYILTALIGSAPLLLGYAFVGNQLSTIQSGGEIFSLRFGLVVAFLTLCIAVPFFARRRTANNVNNHAS